MAKDGLNPGLQRLRKGKKTLTVIEVLDIPQMPKVERNVVLALGDDDNFSTERMRDAGLVEDVRISVRAVANHNAGSIDQVHYVLNDAGRFPNFIRAARTKTTKRHEAIKITVSQLFECRLS